MNLTASNLVAAIERLPKNNRYNYVNIKNEDYIKIVRVDLPEGPIVFKRTKGRSEFGKNENISSEMIWRIANAFREGHPINFDRVLGASYNTRSVLEALIANTPEFFVCYPGRIESMGAKPLIKKGHKHLLWLPNERHQQGKIECRETDIEISEGPQSEVIYESLTFSDLPGLSEPPETFSIDVQRRHAQMQIALYEIGKKLGYKTWIAQNDKGIIYKQHKLGELDGVISNLETGGLVISPFSGAVKAALLIDAVWFKNGRLMPAVMEVEHSTGVTSGLVRMKKLQDILPPFPTRWVIVAPDEDRNKVREEANKEQFRSLNARYFSYSAVEELYSLTQRRNINGVTEEFLDSFMELCVSAA